MIHLWFEGSARLWNEPRAVVFVRFLLGSLLLGAGVAKLSSRAKFRKALIGQFRLGRGAARAFAAWLPRMEAAVGALLLLGLAARLASAAACVLLLAFTVALMWVRGMGHESVECHCFGSGGPAQSTLLLIARNLSLLVLSLFLAVRATLAAEVAAARGPMRETVPPHDVLLVALVVAGLILLGPVIGHLLSARRMGAAIRNHDQSILLNH